MFNGTCLWFNADKVRSTLSKDLGFKAEDRVEQARRMACLASLALEASPARTKFCFVDFVNPNNDTYSMFKANLQLPDGTPRKSDSNRVPAVVSESEYPVFSVFMNTIKPDQSRFVDTAQMFDGNREADFVVNSYVETEEGWAELAEEVVFRLREFQESLP